MASQADQGSRDGERKNEDKNGRGARVKQFKSTKAGPDNGRGAWETTVRHAHADKGHRHRGQDPGENGRM